MKIGRSRCDERVYEPDYAHICETFWVTWKQAFFVKEMHKWRQLFISDRPWSLRSTVVAAIDRSRGECSRLSPQKSLQLRWIVRSAFWARLPLVDVEMACYLLVC